MRIIHATDSSIQNFDGISTYINELILSSESRGDEVMLLCTTPTDKSNLRQINYKGIVKAYKSLRFPGKPKFIYSVKPGIAKDIHSFKPDLIWIHSIGPIGTTVARVAKGKYKVVCTKHSFDGELWCLYLKIPKPFQWIVHTAANMFEKTVAGSCSFFVYHIQDTQKIEHLKYFNKFLKFNPPIQSRFYENRTEKTLEPNKLTLGFCGRCEPDKGIEDTYKGLQLFKEKHPEIEIIFYLIGDGPVAKTVPQKFNSIKTIVTGYTTDVIPFLDKLDGFIISSKHETTSLSSLEAYARGIPIFSLPIGYLSEAKNIENYYLFENNEKLVQLLEKVFIHEKKYRKIPDTNALSGLVINYPELLTKVTEKVNG
jgi:glycosyltransferase involved in cell wall biosynthesis